MGVSTGPRATGRRPSGRWLMATAVIALGTSCDRAPPPTSAQALLNATYLSESTEEGVVTLTEGEYRAPAAPGAASELVIALADFATGDLDGDGEEDAAAVLVERPGGTGTFYLLHALLSDGREVHDVSSRLVGDRIVVEAVRIEDGVIEADLLVRRLGEPVAARPSVPTTVRFVLTNRGLLPADFPSTQGETDPLEAEASGESTHAITGGAWTILSIRTGEDPAMVPDPTGDRPELSFSEELLDVEGSFGRLFGSTGCNRVLGSYQARDAGGIRISGVATTRKACEPALMDFEQLLTLSLGSAIGFEVRGDELDIRFAGGVISLSRVSESSLDPVTDSPKP